MKKRGFTLLEVLVALALVTILSATLAPSFLAQLKFNTSMELRSGAYAAAQVVLDDLRVQDISAFPSSGSDSPRTETIAGRNYNVIVTYCEKTAFCLSATTRHLSLDVEYKGNLLYEIETVYASLS